MDLNTTALENMNVTYSTDGTEYGVNRYAVVVPEHSSNKSYWIKISIANTALNASLSGEFSWFLDDCDESEIGTDAYKSLTSFTFESNSSGAYSVSVSSAGDYTGRLVFPSEVNGTPVTKIAQNSNLTQEQLEQITSVFIPASVTAIWNCAFYGYSNLQEVIFETGSKLTTISSCAFEWCTSLTSVTIPDGVTEIKTWAFYGSGLTSIVIPASVTKIDDLYCANDKFVKIEVDPANTTYHSAGNCLIETATKTLIAGCNASIIPTDGSVTSIRKSAFIGCTGLTNITIPENVTSIGNSAFEDCENLTSVIFENTIGWKAGGTSFTETELSDPATNATYLTTTYCGYGWTRS